jgi:hypothetical protein
MRSGDGSCARHGRTRSQCGYPDVAEEIPLWSHYSHSLCIFWPLHSTYLTPLTIFRRTRRPNASGSKGGKRASVHQIYPGKRGHKTTHLVSKRFRALRMAPLHTVVGTQITDGTLHQVRFVFGRQSLHLE